MSVAVGSRFGIRGLEDLWARLTGRAPAAAMSMADRMILDVLGLGLEQAIEHLFAARPELDEFEDWVVATAGEPDPDRIARYHAWLDGVPPPESVQAWIRSIDEAEPALDADELAHWESEGWVILRNAITAAQAAAAAALLWKVAGADPGDPSTWYRTRTNGLMVQHFQGEELEAVRRSPRVHKAFAQLWGTADLWMQIDRMSFNAPVIRGKRFYAPRLHWDVSLAQPIPFATQAILYLTDTAADQGALELVPGIHNRIGAWLAGIGDAEPREVDLSAQAITIAASAGDLVIWHQGLPHGASPNHASLPRLAQYLTMYSPDMQVHPEWR